jgi:hypothetical protein
VARLKLAQPRAFPFLRAHAISTGTPVVVGGSVGASVGASVEVVVVDDGGAGVVVVVVVDVVVVGVVVVVVEVVVVDVVVVLVVVVVEVVVVEVEVVVEDAARSFFFFPRCHWPAHLTLVSSVAPAAVEDSPVASTIAAPSIK